MKALLCILSLLCPLILFGQAVSRAELGRTNINLLTGISNRATRYVTNLNEHPYNARPGTNISGVFQQAVAALRAVGGGELVISIPGTYYTASNGVALRPGHSSFASYGLQLTNLTNFTLTLGKGVLITLTNNSQKTHAQGAVHVLHGLFLSNVVIRGEGAISGNTANQPNWTGGYMQSVGGSPVYVEYVKNFTLSGLTLFDHFSNPFNIVHGVDITTENITAYNCGEGLQWIECTNLISRFNRFSNPGNVNVGDAFEYANCLNVQDFGSLAFGNTNNTGGSSMDIYASKNVSIDGFIGVWPFGFEAHPDPNGVQCENVLVANSQFLVQPGLRDVVAGILGQSSVSGSVNARFVNCLFGNGVWGFSTDTNFFGKVEFVSCGLFDNSSAGVNIGGGGVFGWSISDFSSNGVAVNVYSSTIANTASNGPTLLMSRNYFASNTTAISIQSQGTNLYTVRGVEHSSYFIGNGTTRSIDVGTTDLIDRNLPADYNALPGTTNTGAIALPSGRNLLLVNSGVNSIGITASNGFGNLFNGPNAGWRWVSYDSLTQLAHRITFNGTNGEIYNDGIGSRTWSLSELGRLNLGGQKRTNDGLRVYDSGDGTNFFGIGQDDSAQASRIYHPSLYPLLFGKSDGNSNFVKQLELTAAGLLLDANGSRYVTNDTGIDANSGGGGSPGGNSGAIQFNQAGALDGSNTFNLDRTNSILSLRNGAATGSEHIYLGGSLSVPNWSIDSDTNRFGIQADFGTSGHLIQQWKDNKAIVIGSTANNVGTNYGDWYNPSNFTVGGRQANLGTVTNAAAVNNAGPVTNWNQEVSIAQFAGQPSTYSFGSSNANGNFFTFQSGLIASNMTVLLPTNTPVGLTRPVMVLSNLVYGASGASTGQLTWVDSSALGYQPTNTNLSTLASAAQVFTRVVSNYLHATTMVLDASTDVAAFITNSTSANVAVLITNTTVGTSGQLNITSDGSARTFSVFCDKLITMLSTNETVNATQLVTTASKRMKLMWSVDRLTATSTGLTVWAKSAL